MINTNRNLMELAR